MANWKHKAYKHIRREHLLFQINVPLDQAIAEFEVVAFKNGTVVGRCTAWDSYDTHGELVNMMFNELTEGEAA